MNRSPASAGAFVPTSGSGLPYSTTLSRATEAPDGRQLVECASPLALPASMNTTPILPRPRWLAALLGCGLAACAGCGSLRDGSLALPVGDPARGAATFRELQCHACHAVSGHDFPAPTIRPPVLVVLGTEDAPPGRRALIDSIINPSHRIYPGYDRRFVQTNNVSWMRDYSDVLTVRQLSDLVAFLETLHR